MKCAFDPGALKQKSYAMKYLRPNTTVAAISSEWWGSGGGAPSGVQRQSPWSGDQGA